MGPVDIEDSCYFISACAKMTVNSVVLPDPELYKSCRREENVCLKPTAYSLLMGKLTEFSLEPENEISMPPITFLMFGIILANARILGKNGGK